MVMISTSVAEPMDPMIPRFGGLRLSGESSWSVVPPMDPETQRAILFLNESFGVTSTGCLEDVWRLCGVHLYAAVVFPVADPEIKLSGGDEAKSRVEEKLQKLKAGGGQADARWRQRSVVDWRVAMFVVNEGQIVADKVHQIAVL
nr:uncharacterized protein LOC109160696 isoform X2 [Ipomoea batatas]